MRRILPALAAVALVATPLLAHAAGTGKVGVIDVGSILEQSTAGNEVQAQLQAFGKQLQAQEQKDQAKLKKEQEDLKKNQSIETKAAQKQAQQKFQTDIRAYQQTSQKRQQEFQQKQASLLSPLRAKLYDVVESYAKKHGYDLIVDKRAAIYNEDSIDITSQILKAFNAAQPHAPPPDTSIGAGGGPGGQ